MFLAPVSVHRSCSLPVAWCSGLKETVQYFSRAAELVSVPFVSVLHCIGVKLVVHVHVHVQGAVSHLSFISDTQDFALNLTAGASLLQLLFVLQLVAHGYRGWFPLYPFGVSLYIKQAPQEAGAFSFAGCLLMLCFQWEVQ